MEGDPALVAFAYPKAGIDGVGDGVGRVRVESGEDRKVMEGSVRVHIYLCQKIIY